MHVSAAAVVALEELGVVDDGDLAFVQNEEIKQIALQLMETSYMDAWWFEHAVVHTVTTLRNPAAQHTPDEL